eukprot:CFRG3222T1
MMDGKLEAFSLWMKDNGVWWDTAAITFAHGSEVCEGYGIVAATDIASGTKVASIKKSAVLSVRTSPISDMLESGDLIGNLGTPFHYTNMYKYSRLRCHVGLTIALLHEMSLGDDSKWGPYIHTLPTEVTMPALWSTEEREWLSGTHAERITNVTLNRLQKEYDEVYVPFSTKHISLFKENVRSFEAYRLAAGLVSSRAFRVNDVGMESEMLPLADMFNHRSGGEHVHIEDDLLGDGSNASGVASDDDVLDIRTVQDVSKGEEMFNTFGDLPASDLLCKYGFVDLDPNGRAHGEAETCRIALSLVISTAKAYSPNIDDASIQKWVEDADGLQLVKDANALTMEEILEVKGVSESLQYIVMNRLKEYPPGKIENDQKEIYKLMKTYKTLSDADRNRLYALVARVEEKEALKAAYYSIFEASEDA